jgi:hypothetical protein
MLLAAGRGVVTNAPIAGWLFEIVGPLVWIALAIVFTRQCLAQRHITRNMLVFIASTTMWWQEWYGDWAAYIIYNPQFQLIPWGSTLWTTPNKPWVVILSYGWYYTLSFLALFWLCDKVRQSRPGMRGWVAAVVVGIPVWYAMDLVLEGGASYLGWWSYDFFVGPALQSSEGNFPLIYPIVFFAAWCVLMGALVYEQDAEGFTPLDRLLRLNRLREGFIPAIPSSHDSDGHGALAVKVERPTRSVSAEWQIARLVAWIAAFNASYWLVFIFPIIIVRELLGPASTLIP